MDIINRLGGLVLVVAGLVLVVHTLADPVYHTSTDASPYSPYWQYINWLTAVGVVVGVICSYMRVRANEEGGEDALVNRGYLVANTQFYGFLFVGILFFWNWFQLFNPEYSVITSSTHTLVWIVIDAAVPLLAVPLGLRLLRQGG